MKNITFLRTVALISHGKLSHLTYRWKGGTSFTLEQIASILYKIERKRAKAAVKTAAVLSIAIGSLLVAASLYAGWHYTRPYGIDMACFASFWIFGIGGNIVRFGIRDVRRLTYRRAMSKDVPASYAVELNKFSDVLQEALKYLGSDLRTVISLHRDDIAAQSAALLESKAMEVVQLEKALDDNAINDDIYDRLEADMSERREEFKLAYAALAALNLVSGGYTNFFRRAMNASKDAVAA